MKSWTTRCVQFVEVVAKFYPQITENRRIYALYINNGNFLFSAVRGRILAKNRERHQKVNMFGDHGHPFAAQAIGLAEATQENGA